MLNMNDNMYLRFNYLWLLVFPGILIAKKALFKNTVPDGCGGGTVFFVTRDSHRYLQDTELREEGGTAAVVESVRAGLVMQLKETIGVQAIMAREEKISRSEALILWTKQRKLCNFIECCKYGHIVLTVGYLI